MTALSPFLLGKVKPHRKTKADSLSVCKFHTFHFIYTKAGPFSSQRQHKDTKGFPFTTYDIRAGLFNSRKLHLTYPPNPVFEVCAFRTYIDISYPTPVSSVSLIYQRSIRRCFTIHSAPANATRRSTKSWIVSLPPSRPSLRAWTRKGSLHPFSQVIGHHQRTKLNPALDGKHIFIPHLNPFM